MHFLNFIYSHVLHVQILQPYNRLPWTIPAAAAAADDDDDEEETMHRHLTKFGETTRRCHQRTPGLRVLPLPALVVIASVAFGNVLTWVIAGVVLVNTNTPPFFFNRLNGAWEGAGGNNERKYPLPE